MTRVEKVDWFM